MNRAKIDLDRLMEAAAEEFGREGFSGARMDAVAERAGVNKALIYYHVGDKQRLFEEVIIRAIHCAVVEINCEENLAEGFSPVDYLKSYINGFYRFFRNHPDYPRVILRELLAGGSHLTDSSGFSNGVPVPLVELFYPLNAQLERGVKEGLFRPVSPYMLHILVVSGLNAAILGSPLMEKWGADVPEENFTGLFFEVLMNGIRKSD